MNSICALKGFPALISSWCFVERNALKMSTPQTFVINVTFDTKLQNDGNTISAFVSILRQSFFLFIF